MATVPLRFTTTISSLVRAIKVSDIGSTLPFLRTSSLFPSAARIFVVERQIVVANWIILQFGREISGQVVKTYVSKWSSLKYNLFLSRNPRFDYLFDNNLCAIKIYSDDASPIKVHRYLLFTICVFIFVLDCTCKCFLGDYALIYISHTFPPRWIIYDLSTKKATRNLAQIKLTRRCTRSKR